MAGFEPATPLVPNVVGGQPKLDYAARPTESERCYAATTQSDNTKCGPIARRA